MAMARPDTSPGLTHFKAMPTARSSGIVPADAGQVSPSSLAHGCKCPGSMLTPSHDAYPSAGLSNPTTGHTGPGSPGWVILRPNRTLSRCPSIGLVLLREL